MRIVQVTGFLGSGKTSFLTKLASELTGRGYKVAVIVNDVGHINVDQKVMSSHGLNVKEVAGGCICCEIQGTFTMTIMNLHMSYKPDIVLVEPSGVAIPWGLKQAVAEASKNSGLDIVHSPIVTFVDCTALEEQMMFVGRLISTQIREADAIMINKTDMCTDDEIKKCAGIVLSVDVNANIMYGSAATGKGVSEMADLMIREVSQRYDAAVEEGLFREQYGGGT
ncbi:MAG: molybdopterin-guanine dinucleotide biosynthesis protein MobB [Methanomassiliicoccaceae archaeon]|jgi:G3E family GTPase|nr:molybdopterin-guanine dinucleotide biosynthesis protein MobB [Methanomassiliicoccaceae archaeon]